MNKNAIIIANFDYTELSTERLYLRTLTEADAELVTTVSDEFETAEKALEWIQWINSRTDVCKMFYIWLKHTNEWIGRVYFHSKAELGGEVEIGYGIEEKENTAEIIMQPRQRKPLSNLLSGKQNKNYYVPLSNPKT